MAELKYVEGNLFAAIDSVSRPTKIAHVCNNGGVWGAGFVVPLGNKFPLARQRYLQLHDSAHPRFVPNQNNLGMTQCVRVCDSPSIWVCNMIAQTLGNAERLLWYNHLSLCMDSVVIKEPTALRDFQIYAPLFGAGLAGGDWCVISALINDCWVRAGIDVTIFYLPGQRHDGM